MRNARPSASKRIAGHEKGLVTFSIYGRRSLLKAMPDAQDKVTLYKDVSLR
jgi:hypothetical protein